MPSDAERAGEVDRPVIQERTRLRGTDYSALHSGDYGVVTGVKDRGKVKVTWDSGYGTYSIPSFIAYLRTGAFEVIA